MKQQIEDAIASIRSDWNISDSKPTTATDVPRSEDLGYSDAKRIHATYMYTDMMDSSGLVAAVKDKPKVVAHVIAAFLKVCVRIIRDEKGHVRSFDGDRVMGVFVGPNRQDRAVSAALKIRYAIRLLDEDVRTQFKELKDAGWHVHGMTGIASSDALLVRAGIRNNADLVSIGVGPNFAAKLSDLRDGGNRHIAVGRATWKSLSDNQKMANGVDMWNGPYTFTMGGGEYSYYTTSYHRKIT